MKSEQDKESAQNTIVARPKVYGLVGKSGTGKSHHAREVAEELGIDCIIDDGLLIHMGRVRAGYSAKFETTPLSAVRRALFTDPNHRLNVRRELERISPPAIMILGTSRHMVETIAARLGIHMLHIHWIEVGDVLNPEVLLQAHSLRSEGKHAIPIEQPYIESRGALGEFVEQVLDRIRISPSAGTVFDTTPIVVRPIFAKGSIYIHPRALRQSIVYFIKQGSYPFTVRQIRCNTQGVSHFRLSLHASWQDDLIKNVLILHREVRSFVRERLGFPYPQVDIRIESISSPKT